VIFYSYVSLPEGKPLGLWHTMTGKPEVSSYFIYF
jgi:hypothetical protein